MKSIVITMLTACILLSTACGTSNPKSGASDTTTMAPAVTSADSTMRDTTMHSDTTHRDTLHHDSTMH